MYDWSPFLTLLRLSPSLVLLLLLRKRNRHLQARLVLIPVVLMCALGFVVGRAMPHAEVGVWLERIFFSAALSLSALWLIADVLASRNRIVSFLFSAVIIVAVGVMVTVCDNCLSFSLATIAPGSMFARASLVLLSGMTITSWMCRRRYDAWRLMLWLPLVLVVLSLGASLILGSFGWFREYGKGASVPVVLGFAFGLGLYIVVLPFMLMTITTPLYRNRFQAVFRLDHVGRSASNAEGGAAPAATVN